MLGLYNRYPMSKEEVEDLIRREFLAMLFEEERNLSGDFYNGTNFDPDPEELARTIIENLFSIRAVLIPMVECLDPEKVDELWSEDYKAQFKAKTGKEVDLETGNTWYPDFMPKTHLTSGFMQHLVALKVEYDIAEDKAMTEFFKQEEKNHS